MAKRPVLSTISNILTSLPFINSNYDAVDTAFDNTLSRDGSAPNNMLADLDLDGHNINNAGSVRADSLVLNGTVLTGSTALIAADAVDVAILDSGAHYSGDTVEQALAQIGPLTGVTASVAELNKLDGATLSTTELNHLTGVTSSVQTQLNAKEAVSTQGTWTPVLGTVIGAGAAGTFTAYTGATEQIGWYRKSGNLVTVWFSLTYSSLGLNGTGTAGSVHVGGLPLTFGTTNVSQTAVATPITFSTTAAGVGVNFSINYGVATTDRVPIRGLEGGDIDGEITRIDGSFSYITDE